MNMAYFTHANMKIFKKKPYFDLKNQTSLQ